MRGRPCDQSLLAATDLPPSRRRKVTLCHILLQDYDRAAESVQKCDPDQAATAYLRLLSFVNQGALA